LVVVLLHPESPDDVAIRGFIQAFLQPHVNSVVLDKQHSHSFTYRRRVIIPCNLYTEVVLYIGKEVEVVSAVMG